MYKNNIKIILSAFFMCSVFFTQVKCSTHYHAHINSVPVLTPSPLSSKHSLLHFLYPHVLHPGLFVQKHPVLTLGLTGLAGLVAYGVLAYKILDRYYDGQIQPKNSKQSNDTTCKTFFGKFKTMPTLNKMRALLLSPLIFGYSFIHPETWREFAESLDLIHPSQEIKKEKKIEKKIEQKIEEKKLEQKEKEIIEEKIEQEQKKELLQKFLELKNKLDKTKKKFEKEFLKEIDEEEKNVLGNIDEFKEQLKKDLSFSKKPEEIKITEKKIEEKLPEVTYETTQKLIKTGDIDTLSKLAVLKENKTKIEAFLNKGDAGNKALLQEIIYNITHPTLAGTTEGNITITWYPKGIDKNITAQQQQSFLTFIANNFDVNFGSIQWVENGDEIKKENALNIAIQRQYVPLVESLLSLVPKQNNILFTDETKTNLALDIDTIFAEKNAIRVYEDFGIENIATTKKDDSQDREVPAIGYFPCIEKIIDYLQKQEKKSNIVNLTMPIFENNSCPIITRFLYFLGSSEIENSSDLENSAYKAALEIIIKICTYTQNFGELKLTKPISKKETRSFFKELKKGVEYLNTYVNGDTSDDLAALILPEQFKAKLQEEINKALRFLDNTLSEEYNKELATLDLEAELKTNNFEKLAPLFDRAQKENVQAYFFGSENQKLTTKIKANRTKQLEQILTNKPPFNPKPTDKIYTDNGEFVGYQLYFATSEQDLAYEKVIIALTSKLDDSPELLTLENKEADTTDNVSMLDLILFRTKPFTLKTYLQKNNGFTKNLYNKQTKTLTLNLMYILNNYKKSGNLNAFSNDIHVFEGEGVQNYYSAHRLLEKIGIYPLFKDLLEFIKKLPESDITSLSEIYIQFNDDENTYTCPVIAALLYHQGINPSNNLQGASINELILHLFMENEENFGSIELKTEESKTSKVVKDFYKEVYDGLDHLEAYVKKYYFKKQEVKKQKKPKSTSLAHAIKTSEKESQSNLIELQNENKQSLSDYKEKIKNVSTKINELRQTLEKDFPSLKKQKTTKEKKKK